LHVPSGVIARHRTVDVATFRQVASGRCRVALGRGAQATAPALQRAPAPRPACGV